MTRWIGREEINPSFVGNGKNVKRHNTSFEYENYLNSLERHGRFHQLIKSSKAKRSEREDRLKEETKEKNYTDCIKRQKYKIEDLKMELADYKAKYEDLERDTQLLQKLYDNGYIDLEGNPVDEQS